MKPLLLLGILAGIAVPLATHPEMIGEEKSARYAEMLNNAVTYVGEAFDSRPTVPAIPPHENKISSSETRNSETEQLVSVLSGAAPEQAVAPHAARDADVRQREQLVARIQQKAGQGGGRGIALAEKPASTQPATDGSATSAAVSARGHEIAARAVDRKEAPVASVDGKQVAGAGKAEGSLLNQRELQQLGELVEKKELPAIDLVIEFEYDSANLSDEAMPALRQIGQALSDGRLRNSTFVIAGHTDAVGSHGYNDKLSLARAHTVRDYLKTHFQLPEQRLVAVGYGKKRLKNSAAPKADENRRVEFVNLAPRKSASLQQVRR